MQQPKTTLQSSIARNSYSNFKALSRERLQGRKTSEWHWLFLLLTNNVAGRAKSANPKSLILSISVEPVPLFLLQLVILAFLYVSISTKHIMAFQFFQKIALNICHHPPPPQTTNKQPLSREGHAANTNHFFAWKIAEDTKSFWCLTCLVMSSEITFYRKQN